MRTIQFIIDKKYTTVGLTGTDTYTVPMYDQNYTINYSYPESAFGKDNFTETEFADLQMAYNTDLIVVYNFTWSGLTEDEKEIFDNILKAFNNSFQPFLFKVYDDATPIFLKTFIINNDSITTTKDKFELWTIAMSLIQYDN